MDKCGWGYPPDRSECDAWKGEIMLTGQLGDVMKESARTGISYIRSVSRDYQIADDFLKT